MKTLFNCALIISIILLAGCKEDGIAKAGARITKPKEETVKVNDSTNTLMLLSASFISMLFAFNCMNHSCRRR